MKNLLLKNIKNFFKRNFLPLASLGGLFLLTLIFLILIAFAAIETKRPTAYTDIAVKTTGNGDAFDGNSATFSTTSYNATHDPSIIYHGWTAAGQIYTALDLKLTYSADAATNDTYAYYYSTSGATNCSDYTTRSWSTLLSSTSAGAPQTTLTQALSASQDLTQLCIKIATAKIGSPDNKNVYTHEIWTEGTYTVNNPPSATTPTSISQATNGSGYITFSTTISDSDSNETRLKVEYSDNGGSTWYDPDLVSAAPNNGAVDMDDANTYQIGTSDGIDTDNFANVTLTIVWDTKSASNGGGSLNGTDQSDIQIRVTPYDGIANGTTQASSNFSLDNLAPIVTDTNISIAGGTGTSGAYKIGDTIMVTWNNSAGGDNNSGLSSITANLSPWGGSATITMTDTTACSGIASNNIYEACYTIVGTEGKDADNQNASVTASDNFGNSATTSDTTNAKIDTIAPTGLTALVAGTTGSTIQTLNWTAVTETSFDHYEIWYGTNQSNVQNRTASEWDNSDDVNLATVSTATTTITGLSPSTTYYFKIWAVDDVGNEETVADINTTTTAPANNPPSATTPSSISQYTNGSGYLSFQTTVSDADFNNTKLKVEYSDDGGGTWKDPDLISATPSSGSVDLDDANPYQVGTVDAIDTSGSSVTLTVVWDTKSAANDGGSSNLNNIDQSDIQIRVTPNDGTANGSAQASANFSADNLNPSGLTALTAGATGTTTQVLNWSAVTENNFNHYEIWYGTNQLDVQNRTGTATEWDNIDDAALSTISTTTTTITGLTSSTAYYFKIWAIDNFGNEQTVADINTTTGSGNSAPSATIPFSITQATNGSGYITFSTTISDPDSNKTKLKIEYSDNGGSTWYDPDLVSATPNNGAIDLNDANIYQIGTSDGIDTDGFANITLVIVWDTKSALNGGGSLDGTDQSDIKIRVTPNDGTVDGSIFASANFSVDNLNPSGLSALTTGATTSVTQILNWSAVTETNFDHYEIWYGTNQTDVANRSGTAVEWDNVDDINLATISTTTTTITGLTEDTTYYYKIWAIDDFGNEHTVATSSKKTNHKPAISGTAGVQQTDDGYVNITYTLADNDSNTCSLSLYEYSLDNSTWFTMTAATGDPAHQGISGLTSSPAGVSHTFVWNAKADVNGTFDTTVFVRLRANDGIENGNTDTSASFALDVKDPIGLASFTGSSATTSSITWTWAAVTTEDNFNHYEIWYGTNQTDVANRAGTAVEWDNTDDAALVTMGTATTTITGLASSTLYYAKIWAVDNYQNEATTTGASYSTQTPNSAPSATTPSSVTQATNGSGYITFSTTISDPDSNETKLKIEYSDNGGSTWYDPDLVSATPNNGIVDLNDANTYQVGTLNGIDTDNFASVTLSIVWDTKSASNGNGSLDNTDQSDIKIRVIPNDGTIDGSVSTSDNFQVDNLDPNVTAANVFIRSDTCTGTGGACKNGDFPVLRWDGNLDGETDTITSAVFNGSQLKSTNTALSGSNLGLNIWETLLTGALDSQEDIGNTISVIVTDDMGNSTGPITSLFSYIVDTVLPTAPGNLVDSGAKTSSSITLNFGSVGSDGLFEEYKIFHKANIGGVTENDSAWSTANDPNLGFINYNGASSTTVTGLNASTNYYFNIWIYDAVGNKVNATEIGPIATNSGNSAPIVTAASSISQAIDVSGYITFQTTISDVDLNNTKLKVEYSDNGGSNWYDPYLVSAIPSSGTADLNNTNAYQVGTTDSIDTSGGNATLTIVWNTKSASNGNGSLDNTDQSDIKIRVTPNDGTIDGAAQASSNFSVDNLAPSGLTALTAGTTTSTTQALNWSAVTESNFNHYEIWYGQNQSDVQNRSGTATEWDNIDDINLATISTTTTTITGLSSSTNYYFKIWVIDDFGNEETVVDISAATISAGQVSVPSGGGTVGITATETETVFSSSTDPAVINIPSNVNDATLNLDALIDNLNGTGTLPSIIINSLTSAGNINIEIPANTNIDAGGAWNGIMNAPTVQVNNSVNPGSNTTVEAVIEIGFGNTALVFDQAVRIRFAGNAGKRIGYSINNIFTEITNTCGADNQATGNALSAGGDCKINVGSDLVVWTKHFTSYVVYITTTASIPPTYSLPELPLPKPGVKEKEIIYDYQYISQSANPILKSGEAATLTLTLKNTGNTPWSKLGMKPTRLGTSRPNDRISNFYHSSWLSGNRIVLKQDTINSGEIGSFEFTIQAKPDIQFGIYREYFTPVVEGITWMKDVGIYWEITIGEKISKEIVPINYGFYTVAPGDTLGKIAVKVGTTVDRLIELNKDRFPVLAISRNAISVGWGLKYELLAPLALEKPAEKYDYEYISQSSYPTINPGETAILSLILKNTGNIPWYKSGSNPLRLGTSNPYDRISPFYHSSWLSSNRIALKQDKVNPGEIGSFEFTIQAPSDIRGVFKENFTPVIDSFSWMKDMGIYWEINMGVSYGYYTVIGGDTLGKVAVKLGTTVDRLIELNKDTYSSLAYDRNSISVGWVLKYDLLATQISNSSLKFKEPAPPVFSDQADDSLSESIKEVFNNFIQWLRD